MASGLQEAGYKQWGIITPIKIYDVLRVHTTQPTCMHETFVILSSVPTTDDPVWPNTDWEVQYASGLKICDRDYTISPHRVGGLLSQMWLPSWLHELKYESDSELSAFIEHGIRHGFDIVDEDTQIQGYECNNYPSVLHGEAYEYINNLMLEEIVAGKLLLVAQKPLCIHALGAVDKTDGSYRPITDCHRPEGSSINCHMQHTAQKFKFINLDMVSQSMARKCYMASVDISQAYRSIHVNPDHWTYQGIKWQINGSPHYLVDTRLCFGISCAPYIFQTISNFVVRCMKRRGFSRVFAYLDDYILLESSFEQCAVAQLTLIRLLHSLGFTVACRNAIPPHNVSDS